MHLLPAKRYSGPV